MKTLNVKLKTVIITLFFIASIALLSIVNVSFNKTAFASGDIVAMIGDTGYTSVQSAVENSQEGDEIKLVANVAYTVDEAEELSNLSSSTISHIKVTGKSITFDFNGFSIDCTVNIPSSVSGNTFSGYFSTADGGHLLLKDSSEQQTGKISMTAVSSVHALFICYSEESSITIQSGTYEIDKATSSLIYTQVNSYYSEPKQGVIVSGGTFYLDNIGTGANGSPWIINASGQNTKHVLVDGGSFNADILHQYYPFEVSAPQTMALTKDDATGFWTAVPAKFVVNEQEWSGGWYTNQIGYATLEEAFASVHPEPQTKSSKVSAEEYITVLDDYHITDDTLSTLLAEKNAKLVFEKDLYVEDEFTLPEDAVFDVNGDINVYDDFTNLGTINGGEDTTINLVELSVGEDLTPVTSSYSDNGTGVLNNVNEPTSVYTSNDEDFHELVDNATYVAIVTPLNAGATLALSLPSAIATANACSEQVTVTLLENMVLGEKLTVSNDVTIDGKEFNLVRDDAYTDTLFEISEGATLTVKNLTIDGGNEWTLNKTLYDEALQTITSGTTWADLAKTEENAPALTSAMFLVKGSLEINEAVIKNSFTTKESNGGDASIFKVTTNANLTMTNATVTRVATGGASSVAYLASGATWTINDGTTISETFAGKNGGVCRSDKGKIVMNGGEIVNNRAINSNGTVFMLYGANSLLELNDGLICSNSGIKGAANGRCAPIYLHDSSSFVMNGGSICHNIGVSYGGIDSGKANSSTIITGGEVSNNDSVTGKPNADINSIGQVVISGGSFTQDVTKWLTDDTYLTYNAQTGVFSSTPLQSDETMVEVINLENEFIKRYVVSPSTTLSSLLAPYMSDDSVDGAIPSFYSAYSVVEGEPTYSETDKLAYSTAFPVEEGKTLTKIYAVWTQATDATPFITLSTEPLYYAQGDKVQLAWEHKEDSPLTFTATYLDDINAGTATLVLTDTVFGLTFFVPYEILPIDISTADTVVELTNQLVFSGSEQTQEVSLTLNDLPVTFTVENATVKEAGGYFLTVTGVGNYSGSMDIFFTILTVEISDDANDDGINDIVINDNGGIQPSVDIIVEIISPEEMSDYGLTKRETPELAYRVSFQSRSVLNLTQNATTKLLIPKDLKNKEFKLYHYLNNEMVELKPTIDGNYAVVSINEHSEFVFVTEKNPALLPACLILLIIILEVSIMIAILSTKNKKPKKAKTYSSVLGTLPIFLSLFLKEEIILLSALAVVAVALIAILIVIAVKSNKNALKISELHKQVDDLSDKINKNLKNIELLEAKLAKANETIKMVNSDETSATVSEVVEEIDNVPTLRESLNKSFTARLIQSSDECKAYYQSIKNALLSYKKVKSRVSWNYDSITIGRTKLAQFVLRGKTLRVYFALNPENYDGTKFKVEKAKGKAGNTVPCLYKITSARKAKYALSLIEDLANIYGLVNGAPANETLSLPYESDDALIQKGLIKKTFIKSFR